MTTRPLTRTTALNVRSFVAMPTPFINNGEGPDDAPIDYDGVEFLINHLITNRVEGIVAAGTTAEAATMPHEEQIEYVRRVVEIVNGRVPVMGGAGSNSTREARLLVEGVMNAGAAAALTVMPYYNKPTPAGQEKHFAALCETGAPIMLYSVAGRTGRPLDINVARRLWDRFDNVLGIKQADTDKNGFDRLEETIASGIHMWLGNDSDILPLMFERHEPTIAGVVSVVGNVLPHQVSQLVGRWRQTQGSLEDAEKAALDLTQRQVTAMSNACFKYVNPIGVKTLLKHRGLIENACFRLPLCPLTPEEEREIILLSEEGLN